MQWELVDLSQGEARATVKSNATCERVAFVDAAFKWLKDAREVLVTKTLDADPEHRNEFPRPSVWPFWASVAVGVFFIGTVFTAKSVLWTTPLVFITLVGWFWPHKDAVHRRRNREVWDHEL